MSMKASELDEKKAPPHHALSAGISETLIEVSRGGVSRNAVSPSSNYHIKWALSEFITQKLLVEKHLQA